jgi:hypothetical protein
MAALEAHEKEFHRQESGSQELSSEDKEIEELRKRCTEYKEGLDQASKRLKEEEVRNSSLERLLTKVTAPDRDEMVAKR